MSLASGARFGSYEITGALGAGGMGEVFRARDTRLERNVAIKVLPDAFAQDPERLARFKREAQVLASLNHSHIAGIYGIEESGAVTALVLELVEGPTLADQIALRAIPLDEALPIARQIAEAMDAAHEHGIIHRDLKPANIKLTPGGEVKVLDFGLAKAIDPSSSVDMSASPTLTSPAMTRMGVLLGTAAYMSPEQARGKPLDKRTDIWSFGCVLFEMLTGKRAFEGEDITEALAAIIRGEPDWSALPADTPPQIRKLLKRCLEKDRKRRLADASDALFEIDEAMAAPAGSGVGGSAGAPAKSKVALLPIMGAVFVTAAIQIPGTGLQTANQPIAISHDGRRIFYVGQRDVGNQIYMRALDQLEPVALPGLGGVGNGASGGAIGSIFLSPDDRWIGFNDTRDGTFKRVSVDGGAAALLCPATAATGGFRGASWGANGTIVFSTTAHPGLMQVADTGGASKVLTSPPANERHSQPYFLPGGHALLFTMRRDGSPSGIAVLSLETGEQKRLLDGSSPRYASSGHILFIREGALWAVRFDRQRFEVQGDPVPVQQGVQIRTATQETGIFDVSETGTLVYSTGSSDIPRTLVWVDRHGGLEAIAAPPRQYTTVRLSRDGRKMATDIRDQAQDIFVWDFSHPNLTRLTLDDGLDAWPVWTPADRLIFSSARSDPGLYSQAYDGTGTPQRVVARSTPLLPTGITPDGNALLVREIGPKGGNDLAVLSLGKGGAPAPLLNNEKFNEGNGVISPDGNWVAFDSNESGGVEIYVRPFPNVEAGRFQVSTHGGANPVWARNGKELFYSMPNGPMMAVPVQTAPTFTYGAAVELFRGPFLWNAGAGVRPFDTGPDGRFVMIKEPGTSETGILVIAENWLNHLRQQLPSQK